MGRMNWDRTRTAENTRRWGTEEIAPRPSTARLPAQKRRPQSKRRPETATLEQLAERLQMTVAACAEWLEERGVLRRSVGTMHATGEARGKGLCRVEQRAVAGQQRPRMVFTEEGIRWAMRERQRAEIQARIVASMQE